MRVNGIFVTQISGNQQFAPISISAQGNNIVVPGVVGKQIRLIQYEFVCAGAVVVTWSSSIAGALSGPMSFTANGGISSPYSGVGIVQAAVGEDLILNLSLNVSVGGSLVYVLV